MYIIKNKQGSFPILKQDHRKEAKRKSAWKSSPEAEVQLR